MASVITNVAFMEHALISWSRLIIFLIRETRFVSLNPLKWALDLTWKLGCACWLLTGRNGGCVVWHGDEMKRGLVACTSLDLPGELRSSPYCYVMSVYYLRGWDLERG